MFRNPSATDVLPSGARAGYARGGRHRWCRKRKHGVNAITYPWKHYDATSTELDQIIERLLDTLDAEEPPTFTEEELVRAAVTAYITAHPELWRVEAAG